MVATSPQLGQQRLARLATVSALLVVASFLAAKAARDAILLQHFSIESLPLFTGLSAVLSLPVIIGTGRLMTRLGPHRLVPWMNALSGAVAIVEYLTIHSYPRAVSVVVFFHFNTASAVLVSGFWSIVNERFDIHSAKRHIGRIGMGATLGGIVGGVIAERTAVYLAPDAILIVLAGLQIICATMLAAFSRGAPEHHIEESAASNWSALTGVWKSHLLRRAGLIVVLSAVAAGALDYVFKSDIVHAQGKENLLRSLAVFYTVTNVITAIVQVALSGPILTWFGVPKSVSSLPYTVTGFGIVSLLVPIPALAAVARGSELVTRNSIYRAGYELLYAPLPPEQKRPTKVILDVGADKLGDILAAQLVGAVVWFAADDRTALLFATVVAGAIAVMATIRLPKAYTKSLESSLLEAAGEKQDKQDDTQPQPWMSMTGMPTFGHPGEVVPLQLRNRRRKQQQQKRKAAPPEPKRDVVEVIRQLHANPQQALAQPLPAAAVPVAIDLLDRDDTLAKQAFLALQKAALRNTGALVDAMLDVDRSVTIRRRLTAIVAAGQPELAAWGLWHGMRDPSFEVRYHASARLALLAGDVDLNRLRREEVFDYVRDELLASPAEWNDRKIAADPVMEIDIQANVGLEHVFSVLGLVLPAEPLRVALKAVQTDDAGLRGMALEYLESILPPDVRAQLWPLLDESATGVPVGPIVETSASHSRDLLAKMRESYEHHRVGRGRVS
ncbi:MAG: hypothetical protein QM831_06455 [Kofleriaceae bacterium]